MLPKAAGRGQHFQARGPWALREYNVLVFTGVRGTGYGVRGTGYGVRGTGQGAGAPHPSET